MTGTVILDGQPLTLSQVEQVSRGGAGVELGEQARRRLAAARGTVERRCAGDKAVYGINTGFGSLASVLIEPEELVEIQRNLIRSHSAGVGDALADDVVRALLVVLAASLARGHSGVRVELLEHILALLNRGVVPVIPSRGSVGASGDLAPLSHAALVMIGEGEARVGGERCGGGEALSRVGLAPITLQAKEGLALINGTHLMTAIAALALFDVRRLTDAATASAALALDACRATDASLDARLHAIRRQPGQQHVAERLRKQLAGSQILPSHRDNDPRVQDPYCLRATPQVLGAALDAIGYVRDVVERELGAVTDNPLVFSEEDEIVAGGNFHGMPIAIALDTLAIAVSHVAGIAERRVNWLLTASDSENPVNAHLSPHPGLHSGLMITQYTAAACCNEIQTLATPASVANIPTSAGIEDYNSMGATSAHQVRTAVELATDVIAIELLVMAEALEYQRPLTSGVGVERTYGLVRTVVARLTDDRPPAPDIAALAGLIRSGAWSADAL